MGVKKAATRSKGGRGGRTLDGSRSSERAAPARTASSGARDTGPALDPADARLLGRLATIYTRS